MDNIWVKMADRDTNKCLTSSAIPKNINPAGLFFGYSQAFYSIFQKNVHNAADNEKQNQEYLYLINIGATLTNLHFAFELILKALISLKEGHFDIQKYKTHDLKKLLKIAIQYYPHLIEILKNNDRISLIKEMSTNFNRIRYAERCISIQSIDKLEEEAAKIYTMCIQTFASNSE